jgi:hypothetical protein
MAAKTNRKLHIVTAKGVVRTVPRAKPARAKLPRDQVAWQFLPPHIQRAVSTLIRMMGRRG